MYVLIITGGIGSGKSTAASYLVRDGVLHLDTDQIAWQVRESGLVTEPLVQRFGLQILTPEFEIDPHALAEAAFASPEGVRDLNAIMHPLILQRMTDALSPSCCARSDAALAVVEVPLIEPGSPYLGLADEVMAVVAPEELRVARAVARGLDEHDVRERISYQISDEERAALADTVIVNDSTLEDLHAQLDDWYQAFSARSLSAEMGVS